MNIIVRRIERAIAVMRATSASRRGTRAGRRRGTFCPGTTQLGYRAQFRLTEDLHRRLDALCVGLNVERGVIIRDALDFYLGMAEAELGEGAVVATTIRRKP